MAGSSEPYTREQFEEKLKELGLEPTNTTSETTVNWKPQEQNIEIPIPFWNDGRPYHDIHLEIVKRELERLGVPLPPTQIP